jgi:peroxiredoxin
MTLKMISWISFFILAGTTGTYVVGSRYASADPASAMAAYFMIGAHCPTVAETISTVEPKKTATIPGFQLNDTTGRKIGPGDFKDKKAIAIVFIGTECPLVNLYVSRLADLQREFGPKGLQVLAINSNSQDAPEAVAAHAQKRELPFPVLLDPGQKVADFFKAERTPEAFLLDPAGAVLYRGRIDDQYAVGSDRRAARRHDLQEAIIDVLAGKVVRVSLTEVAGCYIGREPVEIPRVDVTYAKDIAPIVQKHCQECHRPGQVGPFSLITYEQAKRWSATIAEVVRDGRMPPWNADPKHGEFANDIRLPEAERKLLLTWIEQGCPQGNDQDLPPARVFPNGWRMGKPDLVLTMKEKFTIPAVAPKGGIEYQHFLLPTNFTEDVWVQAVEARPDARAVIHHMLANIGDKPAAAERATGDRDMLAAYVPGSKPSILPQGLAKRIPKGAKLVLEMHYTANGTEHVDQSSIALMFAKEPPKHELRARFVANDKFAIPARAGNHRVTADTTFTNEALLLSLSPHMHLRGKSFQVHANYPNGRSEILLSVPRYDFNWQHSYAFKKPIHVPAGTRIECVGQFDNSSANPNNPDPLQIVRWGDQSWEEMMLGVVGYIDLAQKVSK